MGETLMTFGMAAHIADAVVALACLTLIIAIGLIIRSRPHAGAPYRRLAVSISIFLGALCVVQIADIVPMTAADAAVLKGAAAAVTLAALVLLWRQKPRVAAMPSPGQLRNANERLIAEAEAHVRTLRELRDARDVLEQRVDERTRDLEEARQRYEIALKGSDVVLFIQDRDLRYEWISGPWLGLEAEEIVGRTDDDIIAPTSRARLVDVKRRVFDQGESQRVEVPVEGPHGTAWLDLHMETERRQDGRRKRIFGAVVDVTARKANEQKLRFLMHELAHRSKNILAVVQAMARQTGANAGSVDDFLSRFSDRIQALAASHDLLESGAAEGVPLESLVRSQLGHAAGTIGEQIVLDGPTVALSSKATQHIGLALHELATNAAKYGALSVPEGRVSIDWSLAEVDGAERFRMRWREEGGPPVSPPSRRGFGQVVIERTLARSLDASIELDYRPEGVRWVLDVAAENVRPEKSVVSSQ